MEGECMMNPKAPQKYYDVVFRFGLALSLISGLSLSHLPQSLAQDNDMNKMFDDEDLEEPVGNFNAPPPGLQPPMPGGNGAQGSADFGTTPPPAAGFPAESSSSGRGRSQSSGRSAQAPTTFKPVKAPPKGADGEKMSLANAQIEDITDANFPEIIESFDYPNAEIADIVKAISQLTKKNFILDQNVKGRITIIAPTKITVAEAYRAFLAALAANNLAIVPYGKFLKIKQAAVARKENVPIYSGSYYPTSDQMITRIIHLKHISAEDVGNRLRAVLISGAGGDLMPYPQTNSLIVTDYGSNIERMVKVLAELDKPGFDEQLVVVPVKHAKVKDIADMITQIILKEPKGSGQQNPSFGGVPRFRGRGGPGGSGPEELSLVTPDERTNSLIVVGNKSGIIKVKDLVSKLDYQLDPSEAGGVFVYYVQHGEAEKIAQTLSNVASGGGSSGGSSGGGGGFGPGIPGAPSFRPGGGPIEKQNIFGGDVKISPDKNTNSLVITASKQDYEVVLSILGKIDIPRDQVFVEAIIMEMNTQRAKSWQPNFYNFDKDSNGIGRAGYSSGNLASVLNPASDKGAILSFGSKETFELNLGTSKVVIPNLISFISFIQTNLDGNVLSTPQILAIDNEKASIEVGEKIPIGEETISLGAGAGNKVTQRFEEAPISLELTPYIRPDSDSVRMNLVLTVKQATNKQVQSKSLADTTTIISNRTIKTNIVVNHGDTAVLGGLVKDSEEFDESKVPILGDIPILGWLFKSSSVKKTKVNLVAFITPKIIRTKLDSQKLLAEKTKKRIDWVKRNYDGRDPYGKTMDQLPRAALKDSDRNSATKSNKEPISRKR
jgi:general secretion pathway protein D